MFFFPFKFEGYSFMGSDWGATGEEETLIGRLLVCCESSLVLVGMLLFYFVWTHTLVMFVIIYTDLCEYSRPDSVDRKAAESVSGSVCLVQ